MHGILTDGSAWRKVIPLLQAHGLEVQQPSFRTVRSRKISALCAARSICSRGPVTLVGHSYAGMVISGSGKHEKVANLVYIAALGPDENETVAYLMTKHPGDYTLEPITDQAGWLWPPRDVFTNGVAQDAEPADEALLWATRKSFGGVLFLVHRIGPGLETKAQLVPGRDRGLYAAHQHAAFYGQPHERAGS